MCRGIGDNKQITFCGEENSTEFSKTEDASPNICELCGMAASLFCLADDAYLCDKCDRWVHGANFLAQRHVRCLLCDQCHNLTRRYRAGASFRVVLPESDPGGRRQCATESSKLPFLFL